MAEDGDQPEEEAEEEVEEVRDEQGRLVIQPPPIFEKEEEFSVSFEYAKDESVFSSPISLSTLSIRFCS